MGIESRVFNKGQLSKITTAEEAAKHIKDGMIIGTSGFTPCGYPKAVPLAVADRIKKGEKMRFSLLTGASVGVELDEAWAEVNAIAKRFPYQTGKSINKRINAGDTMFFDIHLSQMAQQPRYRFLGKMDVAIVEALCILENGGIVASTSVGNSPIPSLGLVAARLALDEKEITPGDFEIALGERRIPVDEEYRMWLNFVGGPGAYPYYSFIDVVSGRIPAKELKGKMLFVGANALGVYDMRVTPFHKNTPGVELHATVADNIICQRYIRQGGMEARIDMAFIVLMGALAYYLTTRLRLYGAIPATGVLLAGYIWFTYYMFDAGQWINMIYPTLSAIVAVLVGGGFRYLVLERDAREMRSMFSSYLSPKHSARSPALW